jgi:hypothetical protein
MGGVVQEAEEVIGLGRIPVEVEVSLASRHGFLEVSGIGDVLN